MFLKTGQSQVEMTKKNDHAFLPSTIIRTCLLTLNGLEDKKIKIKKIKEDQKNKG